MTFRAAENGTTYDNTCPSTDEKYYLERPGYEWSETLQGVILGAFFWGEGKSLITSFVNLIVYISRLHNSSHSGSNFVSKVRWKIHAVHWHFIDCNFDSLNANHN
jgi:hypothetical protein